MNMFTSRTMTTIYSYPTYNVAHKPSGGTFNTNNFA